MLRWSNRSSRVRLGNSDRGPALLMLLREVRVRLENADFDELLVGCEDLEAVKRQMDEA